MLRRLLPLFLVLAGCSKGPQADLSYIGQARSLAAEWALVNAQASRGRLRSAYVDAMRADIRTQLQTTASALSQPNSRYGQEIAALMKLPPDVPPEALRMHSDRLRQIEDSLESA